MKFHSALSTNESTSDAVESLVSDLRSQLGSIDAAWCFFSAPHVNNADQIVQALHRELRPKALIGCSSEGVIACSKEVERQPAITILAGEMKGVAIHPFHIPPEDWRELLSAPDDLRRRMGCNSSTRAVIGFGDPWTTALNELLTTMDSHLPRIPLIGGMASAAHQAGGNAMLINGDNVQEGFVGMSLGGPIEVRTVVSQGARPIGGPMVITRGAQNVIEQLGGKPALQVLRAMVNELDARDQALLKHGILIGRVISEYRESFGRGDFLVRNITGGDEKSGALAVNELIRIGQTVQFHVRDSQTADEDLRMMLESAKSGGPHAAALLFSCNGRGTSMFDQPHHDISVTEQFLPGVPVAGFFAMGELGPIGGKNFIHGHTASLALLSAGR